MDGNLSREGLTKDLESMKKVGISNLIFLEVGMGVKVTGASLRPSPEPVIGLDSNKLEAKTFENHLKKIYLH
jgi:hypothetical protein